MKYRHKKPDHKSRPGKRRVPRVWMMTDARLGENLISAVQRLPARSGVIFRPYAHNAAQRRTLMDRIARICRRRGHMLLLAGAMPGSRRTPTDGSHGRGPVRAYPPGLRSFSVHSVREIAQARRQGADIMLLSPVFTTQSHPGQRPLGAARFRQLAALCRPAKVIALGGMSAARAAMFGKNCIDGWAAIGAFAGKSVTS
jgi:thiamine-phosphate pyrophosphorylase